MHTLMVSEMGKMGIGLYCDPLLKLRSDLTLVPSSSGLRSVWLLSTL